MSAWRRVGARHARELLAAGALACALLIAVAPPLAAQAPLPALEVQASFDRPQATLGEHVLLTLVVRHPQDLIISVSKPPTAGPDLDIVRVDPGETRFDAIGELATTSHTFVLAPFALGEVRLGTVSVSWLRRDGSTGEATIELPPITVITVRRPDDRELRPLKPQATVGGAPPGWVRSAAAGTVLALATAAPIVGILAWRRRRRRAALEEYVPPDVTPERFARLRLNGLITPTRDASEHYQHFYGEISLVVREYLQARFGFQATALTTRELERRMVDRGVGRWQARLVSGLLDRCDAAVYAHDYPDPASADHDLTLAYEIVELSRPAGLAASEEAVPA